MTLLAALLVAGAVALATFPEVWTAVGTTRRRRAFMLELGELVAGPNPWPPAPAVACGPRLYDLERVGGLS
jgi:hypothetical protein